MNAPNAIVHEVQFFGFICVCRSLILKCPQIVGMDYAAHVEPNIRAIVRDAAVAKAQILNKPASLDLPVRGGASRTGASRTGAA